MSCKYYNKVCSRCKKSDDYLVFDRDDLTKITLANYKKYLDFDIEVCPYCGYISTDIEKGYIKQLENVFNSENYNNVSTYSYITDLVNELNSNLLNSYPANLYECYGILQESEKNYENAIKGYFRAVVLKETLIIRYNQQKNEDYEDLSNNEIKSYDKVSNILSNSIKQNIIKILNIYKLCEKNIFLDLINIECLKKLELYDKANKCLNAIKSNLPNEIIDYFDNL